MRKYPDKARRWDLRRKIDSAEVDLEVSELEKVLSHLAFLMNLHVERDKGLERRLYNAFGLATTYTELQSSSGINLREIADELSVRSGIIVFWMWRSWLLQKDLPLSSGQSPFDTTRHSNEWDWLPDELIAEREKNAKMLTKMGDDLQGLLDELPKVASESTYILQEECGSPLAVVLAAEKMLLERAEQLGQFREKLSEAYGFGGHHKPNKKFDLNAKRDLRTYFKWKLREFDESYWKPFAIRADGSERSRQAAKTAADKIASRTETRIQTYRDYLEKMEREDLAPIRFFARKL